MVAAILDLLSMQFCWKSLKICTEFEFVRISVFRARAAFICITEILSVRTSAGKRRHLDFVAPYSLISQKVQYVCRKLSEGTIPLSMGVVGPYRQL